LSEQSELAAWLRLTLTPGIGGETQRKLLKAFGPPPSIFSTSAAGLARVLPPGDAERLLSHDCRGRHRRGTGLGRRTRQPRS
jgi:DNA processing protein